jgi:hypothetical protein
LQSLASHVFVKACKLVQGLAAVYAFTEFYENKLVIFPVSIGIFVGAECLAKDL